MARPLGAFLFFPGEELTDREAMSLFGRYALTSSAFCLYAKDPREVFAELPYLAFTRRVTVPWADPKRGRAVGGN